MLAAKQPLVISHNGASGDFPGCTMLAYRGAVRDGASHIDCPVQMSSDGVAFCNESPDLLEATDVSLHSDILQNRSSFIYQLQPDRRGVYSFNLTWHEISTLKGIFRPTYQVGMLFFIAFHRLWWLINSCNTNSINLQPSRLRFSDVP